MSGPLIDRIDIHVEVPPVPWRQLRGKADGLSSEQMRQLVISARDVQRRRFSNGGGRQNPDSGAGPKGSGSLAGYSSTTTNATMSSKQVRTYCKLDDAGEALLKQAMTELGLSARAHDKVLRIARTIADIEGVENIESQHLAEAIQYRKLDRKL